MFDENTLQLIFSAVLVAAGFLLRSAWDWFQRRRTWLEEARGAAYIEYLTSIAELAKSKKSESLWQAVTKIGLAGSPEVLNAMMDLNSTSKILDTDENYDLFATMIVKMRADLLVGSVDKAILLGVLFNRKAAR